MRSTDGELVEFAQLCGCLDCAALIDAITGSAPPAEEVPA